MSVQAPGPAVDLIEHAAGIIVEARKQPHTAPGHWAGALWEAGMLVAPGTAPSLPACSNCESESYTCAGCGVVVDVTTVAARRPQPVEELVGVLTDPDWGKTPAPRAVVDREAVERVILDHVWHSDKCPCGEAEGRHAQHLADMLMTVARPMPTREQIAEALHDRYWPECADEDCPNEHFFELADAVLALINGSES